MVIAGVEAEPAKADEVKQWTRNYWSAVHPYDLPGAYPNFMMDDEGDDRVRATFGDNYPRLSAIKQQFDPHNLFHVNHNIRPANGAGTK
jgi:FAD/FMN-containing dehydrogenase